MPDLHPELEPLAFLIGTWNGTGRGVYPTIEPFAYSEEITIGPAGKPFLSYQQRTWSDDGPLHTEVGYWRPGHPGRVELVIAQPTGITEVNEGVLAGSSIRVRSRIVGLTRTAKPVASVERHFRVEGDELRYQHLMGAMGQDHQLHLEAALRRQ